MGLKLISTQVVVEVEVGVELDNFLVMDFRLLVISRGNFKNIILFIKLLVTYIFDDTYSFYYTMQFFIAGQSKLQLTQDLLKLSQKLETNVMLFQAKGGSNLQTENIKMSKFSTMFFPSSCIKMFL